MLLAEEFLSSPLIRTQIQINFHLLLGGLKFELKRFKPNSIMPLHATVNCFGPLHHVHHLLRKDLLFLHIELQRYNLD